NMTCVVNYLQNIFDYLLSSNGIGLMFNIFLGGVIFYLHQNQKASLDKAVERYKNELQAEFFKTEIKITQLFNIYPAMYAKIKYAEGELFLLHGPVKRQRLITQEDKNNAWKVCLEARNFLNTNLLFISEETQLCASQVFDAISKCVDNLSEAEMREIFEEIEKRCKALEMQMKKELAHESKL
ncbi:MAG: hypothetical protein ACHP65_10360, partial [Legionellales bacterium]